MELYNCTIGKRDSAVQTEARTTEAEEGPRFHEVLTDALRAVEQAGFPFLVLGGLASSLVGRPRWTHDIDFLVMPNDARAVLRVLEASGFRTEETDPAWIYKAFRDNVMVDIIFMVTGGIYLDRDMLDHAIPREYEGLPMSIPSPEDQVIIKAIVHTEETSRHWFDALAILGRNEMDWDYLLRRGRLGVRRLLALLVYAQSSDILVPSWVIRRLYDEAFAE
ncbi:MAG: nucleotidyltransferase family protein [Candidatus Dormibacteraeota bacterium]|nr:nucleotidyltransferase family protein [Candidatus Dormibacteraeota bacterium]